MEKIFQLPKKFAEKWYVALESGKYIQGTDTLVIINKYNTDKNEYCCLGVAGCILGLSTKAMENNALLNANLNKLVNDNIPEPLLEETSNGIPTPYKLASICTNLNDGLGEIAYRKIMRQYPNIIFKKPLNFKEGTKHISFSFKEIVEFLKDNVELI